MKNYILYLILCCSSVIFAQSQFCEISVQGLKESTLYITGKTNINTFTCEFNTEYLKPCQQILYCEKEEVIEFKNAGLVLKATGFDCGSRGINRDFQKLLQTDKYPEIKLELLKAELKNNKIMTTLNIVMAGKSRTYAVPVAIRGGETKNFNGQLVLQLSDYDLSLPSKLFGLIEVKDEITIDFDIAVKFKMAEQFTQAQSN